MLRAITTFLSVLSLAGCASTLLVNRDYASKLRPDEDKLLMMPLELHGFPEAVQTELEHVAHAQYMATFGDVGVSLQPVKLGMEAAGFGRITWRLAQLVFHVASVHRSPHLVQDRCRHGAARVVGYLGRFVTWAIGALQAAGAPVGGAPIFRYILVVSVEKLGKGSRGRPVRLRVVGGIVDVEKKEIVAAKWIEKDTEANKAAILVALAITGRQLASGLRSVFNCGKVRGRELNVCRGGASP